jgi:hypothetical protein
MDADVVGLDPALGEQFLDVAVRPPKRRYQRTARTMMSGGKRNPRGETSWREQDAGGEFSYRQSHWSDTVAAHAQCPEVSSTRRSAPRGSRKVFRSGQVRSVE